MKTAKILKVMHILSWIVFIGLCIKTGAILISYFISTGSPEAARNLYTGLDLSEYYNHSFRQYTFIVSYKVALFATEAYIAFLVTELLSSLNLEKPFNLVVQKLMQNISYSIFNLWVLAILHNAHVKFLAKKYDYSMDLFSSDFIFLAGVIFIFAQMVKRGIEIQSENDLTI
ncbi:DUF2975 domain-containing protein [Polaribacter glomeratus]|uniref:DUF2975 domain-containing protein n=1 Tax=Polaribacter glomeratus TaxID=102 RepID=A0A2S7WIF1_9FLAO|nr:DUF2975 domain-containing protein [Polaribacter glomeratus]PQJ77370.1 hypothetical protein BTO16_16195 [Polaribacter glomeratus]TXD65957.1 DUF2975 domain-containing protein [Polaribacter glomeratus]